MTKKTDSSFFHSPKTDPALEEYIKEFSRLSLMVSGLDDQSRALLFVRGLSASLRYEAIREHPRAASEALRSARMAHRQVSLTRGSDQRRNREGTGYPRPSGRNVNETPIATDDHPFTTQRTKLSESDRAKVVARGSLLQMPPNGSYGQRYGGSSRLKRGKNLGPSSGL